MKVLLIGFLTLAVVPQSWAEASKVVSRKIGDVYASTFGIDIAASFDRTGHRDYHARVRGYDNTAVFESQVDFGVSSFGLPRAEFAGPPYMTCSGGGSFWNGDDNGTKPYNSSSPTCQWNVALMRSEVKARHRDWISTSVQFSLEAMGPKMNYILGKFSYEGPKIATDISGAGRTRVEFPVRVVLSKCQRKTGEIFAVENLTQELAKATDLREILSSMRSLGFDRLVRCEFKLDVQEMLGDVEKLTKIINKHFMTMSSIDQDDRLFLKPASDRELILFNRVDSRRDRNVEATSIAAAERLIKFITEEYGDLLYRLDNAKKSEAEKEEIIKAFFVRNETLIRGELKIVDDNYSEVSLMNKISMLLSFDRMYASIRQIEARVSKSNVTLDRVIQRPVTGDIR